MLQFQLRGDEISSLVSPESQQKSKDGTYQLSDTGPAEPRLCKKHLEANECPVCLKPTYQGTAPRQRILKREMSLASWSTLLGTADGVDGPSDLIQLFPCDLRDSLSAWSRPEPSTFKCKPQSPGLQWGWRHTENVALGQHDPNSKWRPQYALNPRPSQKAPFHLYSYLREAVRSYSRFSVPRAGSERGRPTYQLAPDNPRTLQTPTSSTSRLCPG